MGLSWIWLVFENGFESILREHSDESGLANRFGLTGVMIGRRSRHLRIGVVIRRSFLQVGAVSALISAGERDGNGDLLFFSAAERAFHGYRFDH